MRAVKWLVENINTPCILCEGEVAQNSGYYFSKQQNLTEKLEEFTEKFPNTDYYGKALYYLSRTIVQKAGLRAYEHEVPMYLAQLEKYKCLLEEEGFDQDKIDQLCLSINKIKLKIGILTQVEYIRMRDTCLNHEYYDEIRH